VPPLVLVGGGLALWMHSRRRPKGGEQGASPALTAEEEARLRQLMGQETPSDI